MKKIRFSIFLSPLLLFSAPAFSQFGMGAQLTTEMWQSKINHIDANPTTGFGLGIQAFYNIKPKMRVKLGAEYTQGIPKTFTAGATYTQTTTAGNFSISPDFQYALQGSFTKPGFAFYVFAGLDLNAYNYWVSGSESGMVTNGSGNIQSVTIDFKSSKNYMGFTPHLGLGAEYGLTENTRLSLELKYAFGSPVPSHVSDSDVHLTDEYNPSYAGIDLGLRFGFKGK